MNQQQRHGGGRHARNTARLAQRVGTMPDQFLPHLARQTVNLGIIEIQRQRQLFVAALAFDLLALALDVTGVLWLWISTCSATWGSGSPGPTPGRLISPA